MFGFRIFRNNEKKAVIPSKPREDIEDLLRDEVINAMVARCANTIRWQFFENTHRIIDAFEKSKCNEGGEYIEWHLDPDALKDYPELENQMKEASNKFLKRLRLKLLFR